MTQAKKYQILKLIGKGGTAVLYKAIQMSLDRVVAIKRLHQHLTEDENFTRRFVLEAKAAASLDQTNIVKIIDFGSENRSYFMVMEYIEGDSLRAVLDQWKKIPLDVSLAIVYEVLAGLEHAHAKGIVHRDIKPGNIMITQTGQAKITDFGLAKLLEGASHHTAADTVLGTPLYMSPEQAFGESVDQRSDLFSLGTMLYEMMTGVQPFHDDNYMGVLQNIAKKNAPHPSKFGVEIPQQVQTILSRAMNKNREARYQNASQFRQAIVGFLGHEQLNESRSMVKHLLTTDGATVLLPRTIASEQRRMRARRGLVATFVVVAIAGGAGIGYTFAPPQFQHQVHATLRSWVGTIGGDTPRVQTSDLGTQMGNYLDAAADSTARPAEPRPAPATAAPQQNQMAAKTAPPPVPAPQQTPPPTQAPVRQPAQQPAQQPVQQPVQQPPPVQTQPTQTQPAQVAQEPVKETPPPVQEVRTGWLSIETSPSAEVYINNSYRGDTPLQIELPAGTHRLECRNPMYEGYKEHITITSDEMSRRSIALKKITGQITISATAGAEVLIDGVVVGTTPLKQPIDVDAGSHLVTVKKAGYNVWNNTITVSKNQNLPLNIILSPMY